MSHAKEVSSEQACAQRNLGHPGRVWPPLILTKMKSLLLQKLYLYSVENSFCVLSPIFRFILVSIIRSHFSLLCYRQA